jgi:hypothetical protein
MNLEREKIAHKIAQNRPIIAKKSPKNRPKSVWRERNRPKSGPKPFSLKING